MVIDYYDKAIYIYQTKQLIHIDRQSRNMLFEDGVITTSTKCSPAPYSFVPI